MKERLITFETAKLAKEKGFTDFHAPLPSLVFNEKYMPTQSFLQKWLRDKHNMYVTTRPYKLSDRYQFFVTISSDENNPTFNKFDSYEEALEKGLQEALKLLKQ